MRPSKNKECKVNESCSIVDDDGDDDDDDERVYAWTHVCERELIDDPLEKMSKCYYIRAYIAMFLRKVMLTAQVFQQTIDVSNLLISLVSNLECIFVHQIGMTFECVSWMHPRTIPLMNLD